MRTCTSLVILILAVGSLLSIPRVSMAAWPADDCPSPYDGLSCSVGGTAVCEDKGTYIECYGFDSSNTEPDDLWAVHGSTGNGIIWGTSNYTDFCCIFEDAPDRILVRTYAGADYIALNYTDGTRYDWEGTSLIESGVDDDEVYGSAYNCGVLYSCDDIDVGYGNDDAYGYDGSDSISAPSDDTGNNYFRGGDGGDRLLGGGASDVLFGDPGNDLVRGGGGMDYLYGGDGDDRLNGGDGGDGIEGGLGDDILCGDGYDDSATDKLDGQQDTDTCIDDLDTCLASCETPVAGPANCPF